MTKRILIAFLFCIGLGTAQAQQDPMFSQYMFNMLTVNPAYAGSRDVLSLTAMRRWQWVNIDGAPRTTTFSADMPIANERMGLGLIAYNDQLGVTKTNSAYLIYSYRIRMEKGTLAFGMQAGFSNYRSDLTSLRTTDVSDDNLGSNVNKMLPNVGAGVYYNTDRFYVGISTPKLLNNKLGNDAVSNAIQKRHLFAMAGYVIHASELFKIKPSVLGKYVEGAPLQLDGNLNVWFNDVIGLGASFRSGDALSAMLEIQATDQLRFGYAYDYAMTKLNNYTSGTHEIMLRYELGFGKTKIITPRYF